jgi:hypothetical protein
VQDAQYLHIIVHLVHDDERQGNKNEFASALDATAASQIRERLKPCTLNDTLRNPTCGLGMALGDVVADPLQVVRSVRRPSGRALAAIALVDPRSDLVMIQQAPLASSDAALLDFPTEPIVMLDRVGQKIQRDLIGVASGFGGEPIQLGFKFWRNMQVHESA